MRKLIITPYYVHSPTQWSIKMKFTPLGSLLKSIQMYFKTALFGDGQRSYEAVKSTHTLTVKVV